MKTYYGQPVTEIQLGNYGDINEKEIEPKNSDIR